MESRIQVEPLMSKRTIIIILCSLGFTLIISIPIIFFAYNFKGSSYADDIAQWGAFGDYFGGIFNSFFSLLSLIVTIIIAFQLSKIEDNRYKENLKFEKEKLLREFRESEYKRISFELQKIWYAVTDKDSERAKQTMFNCSLQYRYFITGNNHLFDFLRSREIMKLNSSIDGISTLFKSTKEVSSPLFGEEEINKSLVIREFVHDLDAFNRKFQKYLLNS